MADHRLETIIQLRYGTYSQWMNSHLILKQGEAAICSFPTESVIDSLSNITPAGTPPAIGIKIGDGHSYFWELPWIQAVAADVHNWAKSSHKPTYTASEITGLQSFIEEHFNLSGDITIAPRIYQIVEGTDENAKIYYLRYKENNENSAWVVDTNNPINLQAYEKVANWIGIMVDRFPTLGTFTGSQMNSKIESLSYEDNAQTNKFVTAVSEANGIVSVERAQPAFNNLSGSATVQQGGTGRQTLTEDSVLVGNGTNQVKLIPIAESIANNNHLVPNNLIKAYVDNAVAGLAGAMHFVGDATVVINNNSSVDPRISGYNFSEAQPGDVILYDAKEFVWTGGNWRVLGDETSYAVKGSIKDADIDANAEIQQSKIAGLDTTFSTKVDKVEGKILTSNDFTDELKLKLDGIAEGAQRNVIEHIILNGTEIRPGVVEGTPNTVSINVAVFDESAQLKLQGIAAGAEVNKIEKIVYDGTELIPNENRVVTINPDPHTEHENKIEQIFLNNVEWVPNANKQVRIILDQAALNLNVLEGATIPNGQGGTENVTQVAKKLQLERIAVTGDVKDLNQTSDTYIILNCGSSTEVV